MLVCFYQFYQLSIFAINCRKLDFSGRFLRISWLIARNSLSILFTPSSEEFVNVKVKTHLVHVTHPLILFIFSLICLLKFILFLNLRPVKFILTHFVGCLPLHPVSDSNASLLLYLFVYLRPLLQKHNCGVKKTVVQY